MHIANEVKCTVFYKINDKSIHNNNNNENHDILIIGHTVMNTLYHNIVISKDMS